MYNRTKSVLAITKNINIIKYSLQKYHSFELLFLCYGLPFGVHGGDICPLLSDGVKASDAAEIPHAVKPSDDVDQLIEGYHTMVCSRHCVKIMRKEPSSIFFTQNPKLILKSLGPIDRKFHGDGENDRFVLCMNI